MSDADIREQTPMRKLFTTPLRNLVRFQVTGWVDLDHKLAAAALPPQVDALIRSLLRKTRLRRFEKIDVADELIAHFQDGQAAGRTPEQLVRDFGDLTEAARLIRRAKIRNRSVFWHFGRVLRRAAGVLLLVYLALATYAVIGKPEVKIDYLAIINKPILETPERDRAWPYYNRLAGMLDEDESFKEIDKHIYARPGSQHWPEVKSWLKAHPQVLDLATQAASQPKLGFIHGPEGSIREMPKFAPSMPANDDPFADALISVLLPYLNELRRTANILSADARLAVEERDGTRWMQRIQQMRAVASHASETDILINRLVGIGIEQLRLRDINRTLHEAPDLLSVQQLTELAHLNDSYHSPADLITFRMERMSFADIVQRLYTDDGEGDGHLSMRGMSGIGRISGATYADIEVHEAAAHRVAKFALAPATLTLFATRRQLTEKYDHLLDELEAQLNVPWRTRRESVSALEAELSRIRSSKLDSFRYLLLVQLVPALEYVSQSAERLIAERDACQLAIALEAYKRSTGAYPAGLNELTPRYVPSVPIDPADGEPLRYKLVDGKPLIYSIGADLDDDGGTFVNVGRGGGRGSNAMAIGNAVDGKSDGDWILYPEPHIPEVDDEQQTSTTGPLDTQAE